MRSERLLGGVHEFARPLPAVPGYEVAVLPLQMQPASALEHEEQGRLRLDVNLRVIPRGA